MAFFFITTQGRPPRIKNIPKIDITTQSPLTKRQNDISVRNNKRVLVNKGHGREFSTQDYFRRPTTPGHSPGVGH